MKTSEGSRITFSAENERASSALAASQKAERDSSFSEIYKHVSGKPDLISVSHREAHAVLLDLHGVNIYI